MARGGNEDSLPTLPARVIGLGLNQRCPWCGTPKRSLASATCDSYLCVTAERALLEHRATGGKVHESVDNDPGRAESPEGLP